MLSETPVDIPLIFVIALICAILFCISWPQHSKDTMLQDSSAHEPSWTQETNPSNISSFLVLDVEATCVPGTGFDWPNEIIVRELSAFMAHFHLFKLKEWPVILLKWDKNVKDGANRLIVVDEFQSFVRPTFKSKLHPFCTELTGITQVRRLCVYSLCLLISLGASRWRACFS